MCDRHGPGLAGVIHDIFGASGAPGPAAPTAGPANRRLKLWELEDKCHCPVVGTCLKLDEIKKIARKSGFAGQGFDEYRLHAEAVSVSCTRNPASEAMHKLLDCKFDLFLRRFDKLRAPDEVAAMWRRHLPALLASSDAVICPTDCVGHLAYYQLKRHGKQAGKPCVLVKSSGVASFAAALTRLADGHAEIQPE